MRACAGLFFAAMVVVALGACGGVTPDEPLPDAAETTPDASPDATTDAAPDATTDAAPDATTDAAPDAAPQTLWDVSTWDDPVTVWGP